jgi:ribonuclease Z
MDPHAVKVTITGTGTPVPAPGRAGAGALVQAGDTALQFDTGRGTVLRLTDAGVAVNELDAVFITHHHSDHTSDLADVLHTAWILDSSKTMDVVASDGPSARFVRSALQPFTEDLQLRLAHRGRGPELAPNIITFAPPSQPKRVWANGNVSVHSVRVHHEPVEGAVGYSVETAEGRIVISGDTRACTEMELLAKNAEILVHEVARPALAPGRQHVAEYHTTAPQLGALAKRAGVQTLVLTHLWPSPATDAEAAEFAAEVRGAGFEGRLIVACDLTVVELHRGRVQVRIPSNAFGGMWAPLNIDTVSR